MQAGGPGGWGGVFVGGVAGAEVEGCYFVGGGGGVWRGGGGCVCGLGWRRRGGGRRGFGGW